MGAAMFPVRWGNWESLEKNKTVFLHPGVPDGWWEEYIELTHKAPGPSIMFAREAAKLLNLGEETVRSHLKKAESKLGVHDRTHAVAQAIRQHLIP